MTTNRQTEPTAAAASTAQARQSLASVRVIGVYAHIDAGKTTTSEAMLYLTGRIHRAGSVDNGNTQLDWMDQERERGITITAADITVAEDYLGAVLGDFNRRRGVVSELKMRGRLRGVLGEAPLAEMRGYATDLRNMTQGRGAFTLEFRQYEIVPDRLAAGIIQQRREAGKLPRR